MRIDSLKRKKVVQITLLLCLIYGLVRYFHIYPILYIFLYFFFGLAFLNLFIIVYNAFVLKRFCLVTLKIKVKNVPYSSIVIPSLIGFFSWLILLLVFSDPIRRDYVVISIMLLLFAIQLIIGGIEAIVRKESFNLLSSGVGQEHSSVYPHDPIPKKGKEAVLYGIIFIVVGTFIMSVFILLSVSIFLR